MFLLPSCQIEPPVAAKADAAKAVAAKADVAKADAKEADDKVLSRAQCM